jgi:hypothetical protein
MMMRRALRYLVAPAALALVAGAGIATTAAPAKADVYLNLGGPLFYSTPYYYTPYYYAPPTTYYYAPRCYWDAFYGRVCY